jgi:hypothetical protein
LKKKLDRHFMGRSWSNICSKKLSWYFFRKSWIQHFTENRTVNFSTRSNQHFLWVSCLALGSVVLHVEPGEAPTREQKRASRVCERRGYTWAFFARPNSGPARVMPAHGPCWTGVGRDLEARDFFFALAWPEMLFLVILHYKIRGRPAQARARSESDPKTEARHVPWDGQGHDFLNPEKLGFSQPGPNPPRPVEC